MKTKLIFRSSLAIAAIAGAIMSTSASAKDLVGLVVKDISNPFFAKMNEGAQAQAAKLGMELQYLGGTGATDLETQVEAIEGLVAAGAKGILLVAGDTAGIVSSVEAARSAGVLVIALDTALNPIDAADATFATDNFLAGKLIGQWAASAMGDKAADARIALIDENENQSTVDVARDQGFLSGFGVDIKDANFIGDEDDSRISGHALGYGNEEGGRTAMENLLQMDPNINVVYTINEPTAAGAYEALKAAGKQDGVIIVSVDGGCPGVANVGAGVIGATSMQFPLLMASLGVEAIAKFAKDGTMPEATPGLKFFNTGVELITDKPVDDLGSLTSAEGAGKCWG